MEKMKMVKTKMVKAKIEKAKIKKALIKKAQTNSQILFSIYPDRYKFPKWVTNFICNNSYKTYAKQSLIFYDETAKLEDVKKLVIIREPVNIGMMRFYDHKKLKSNFGWSKGKYSEIVDKNGITNIAV